MDDRMFIEVQKAENGWIVRKLGETRQFVYQDNSSICEIVEDLNGREDVGGLNLKNLGEGWIHWDGGGRPVGPYASVEILMEDGEKIRRKYANTISWRNDLGWPYRRIIAYRVVDEETE